MNRLTRVRRAIPKASKIVSGAACPRCKSELRFYTTVEYGATYEQCTNVKCLNAIPHRPTPDPDCGKPLRSELERLAGRQATLEKRRENARRGGRPRKSENGLSPRSVTPE